MDGQWEEKAQIQATLSNVTCPSNALYYDCHLVPWGLQSIDQMYPFQAWNGNFAMLIFLQNFDYTRDFSVVRRFTLPLLEGFNAWWHCYLNKTVDENARDGYVYNDINSLRQDMEGEDSQIFPNPSGALAVIERSLYFHLMLCRLLEIECPEYIKDMYDHLPSYNTVKGADGYQVFSGWKESAETDGGPYGGSMYVWPSEVLDFFSPHLMNIDNNDPTSLLHIARATLEGPTEIDWLRVHSVDFFPSLVKTRGGIKYVNNSTTLINGLEIFLDNFFGENFLSFADGDDYNRGGLNAGVGTTETIGIMNAVNEMLLGSYPTIEKPYDKRKHNLAEFMVELFPYWPQNEWASFSNLLAKGGHLISSSYNNFTMHVEEPVRITAKHSALESNTRENRSSLLNPWMKQGIDVKKIKVTCNKKHVKVSIHMGKILSFDTIVNEECLVTYNHLEYENVNELTKEIV